VVFIRLSSSRRPVLCSSRYFLLSSFSFDYSDSSSDSSDLIFIFIILVLLLLFSIIVIIIVIFFYSSILSNLRLSGRRQQGWRNSFSSSLFYTLHSR